VRSRVLVAFAVVRLPLTAQQAAGLPRLRAALQEDLMAFVEHQRSDKGLPAVVHRAARSRCRDRSDWSWSTAAGFADGDHRWQRLRTRCIAWLRFSKLFTATAVMALCEQGKLDLDTPVTKLVACVPSQG
jgi:hypothetical protein